MSARPSGRSEAKRRAFTIVELMVALAVTSLAVMVVYQIWMSVTKGGTVEIWVAEVSKGLSNFDTRFREYLTVVKVQIGGTPTQVTPGGGAARTVLKFKPSGTEASAGGTALIKFFKLEQGRVGVEGQPNTAIKGTQVRIMFGRGHLSKNLKIPRADLVMEESALGYPTNITLDQVRTFNLEYPPPVAATGQTFTMVTDVAEVGISAFTKDAAGNLQELSGGAALPAASPCTVRIELDCLEPFYAQRHIYKKVEANAHIGIKMGEAI
ncbi:MAG: prepilin-type N-terminal cleavage/methylation domain-containing protein [Candidatus Riflebacteria bacterium]|nr:prepilin-type N-terminal cleavage/methylation domain-containing protein [Candidatus Riflebacteria bacterium]